MQTLTLIQYLDELLKPKLFRDYAPNGLQVEGRRQVRKVLTGVTASQALLDEAVAWGADAVLVHHGYFWKGEPAEITGMKKRRLATLLANDINLLAYHLPLDAHDGIGNNVQLARVLDLETSGALDGELGRGLVLHGTLAEPMTAAELSEHISRRLGREPLHLPGGPERIRTIAWCTGGAQDYIELAVSHGIDAFISGEVSERTFHTAQEAGIHYFGAGHHATERYGIQALGEHLAEKFELDVRFVDLPNPV
ncbi:Nif3-like dinuclear metal center hexameric protein [Gallaecimonas sp. GXIMD4217]|uniref:Nif3-like dinuclear metal center hexameric protein n=1 Tax=Gallaecimonas sp. GXIMD4217 TaxID=3131927 RepID=UPI00311AE27B